MDPAEADGAAAALHVSVVYSPRAGEVEAVEVELPPGATVADALAASRLCERYDGLERLPVGIWGAFCEREAPVRDRDRVELYRPLKVDPKTARRLRQKAQQATATAAPRRGRSSS